MRQFMFRGIPYCANPLRQLPAPRFLVSAMIGAALGCGVLTVTGEPPLAKSPGASWCYRDVCHRVRTIEQTRRLVGQTQTIETSFYDDPRNDRMNRGKFTSNGEEFDAANPARVSSSDFPDGTELLLRNPENGHTSHVRVNDFGPFYANRTLDVTKRVAVDLGFQRKGVARLDVVVIAAPAEEESGYRRNRVLPPARGHVGVLDGQQFARLAQRLIGDASTTQLADAGPAVIEPDRVSVAATTSAASAPGSVAVMVAETGPVTLQPGASAALVALPMVETSQVEQQLDAAQQPVREPEPETGVVAAKRQPPAETGTVTLAVADIAVTPRVTPTPRATPEATAAGHVATDAAALADAPVAIEPVAAVAMVEASADAAGVPAATMPAAQVSPAQVATATVVDHALVERPDATRPNAVEVAVDVAVEVARDRAPIVVAQAPASQPVARAMSFVQVARLQLGSPTAGERVTSWWNGIGDSNWEDISSVTTSTLWSFLAKPGSASTVTLTLIAGIGSLLMYSAWLFAGGRTRVGVVSPDRLVSPSPAAVDLDVAAAPRSSSVESVAPETAPAIAVASSAGPTAAPAAVAPIAGAVAPSVFTGSYIGAGVIIEGTVISTGRIEIAGNVIGTVSAPRIEITSGGSVEGQVTADDVVVDGRFNGSIEAVGVSVGADADLVGDVVSASIAAHPTARMEAQFRRRKV